ncbi:MAG: hypothetical protein QF437_27380 [Planctomycetota bacterium]|nr:hypothetical protein [Planctomycetota bacterium]MDP7134252.1 hypothetical protein [Planctomycetota bacterium]MDP7253365.1 hypothetical protein [Planctomycetota bacterium]
MNFSDRTVNRRDFLGKSGGALGRIALASLSSSVRPDAAAGDTLIPWTTEIGRKPCNQGSTHGHVIRGTLS